MRQQPRWHQIPTLKPATLLYTADRRREASADLDDPANPKRGAFIWYFFLIARMPRSRATQAAAKPATR